MNKLVKADIKAGHQWKYTNKTSKKAKNFDEARSSGKYYCNCVDGVQWGLLKAGLAKSDGLAWYGQESTGMNWIGTNAKKNAEKYMTVKKYGSKTVKQLKASGELQPGDIVTYVSTSHTNVYLGGNKWFDSGHASCTTSGELAPYKASGWIRTKNYDNYKVGYVLRIKETVKYVYRVRLGIYSVEANAINKQNYMKSIKYDTFREQKTDGWHVYCGSFLNKSVAKDKVAELAKKKIPAEIEKVQV